MSSFLQEQCFVAQAVHLHHCIALGNHLEAKFDLALVRVGHPVHRNQSPWDQFVDYPDSVSACGPHRQPSEYGLWSIY